MATVSSRSPSVHSIDFDTFPIPRHLEPALGVLLDFEYTPEALRNALSHMARFGTAECCPWIDPEHRAIVEDALPRDPAWQSPEWDVDTWEAPDLF
jgi:hypothetical protein